MAVESIDRLGEGLDGIVVARVLDLRPHPNADKIQLVDVDAGDGEALQICCGAFNMAVGDLVPLATLGTVMPGGMKIERRKLRGEWSNGMLCSGRELGLGDDHAGILILDRRRSQPGTDADARRWASSTTCSTTSRSTPTGPTPCRWPAWPVTSPPASACRSPSSSPGRAVGPAPLGGRASVEIARPRPVRPLPRPACSTACRGRPSPRVDGQPAARARHAPDQQRGRRRPTT